MQGSKGVLHLVCGKAAAGKSTLAAALGAPPGTVVIAEDVWLSGLFGDQMATLADYVRCADKLRGVLGPHVITLLRAGVSVVLDFPANTIETRAWMRGLAEEAEVTAELHVLDVPDAVCKARLRARNASGTHPFTVSDEQFDRLARHFVAPTPEEGFVILRHGVPSL